MSHKVLCDENIPRGVEASLIEWGFDVKRVKGGISDERVASQARREHRVLITFDADFANIITYPPSHYYGIVRIAIIPPFIEVVLASLGRIFSHFRTSQEMRGKLLIAEAHGFRVWEGKRDSL